MSPEEAVTQAYDSSGFRIYPLENRTDSVGFRMINTALDNRIETPGFESVFRTLPIAEDTYHRMMEPPGWNVFRMNPVDYRIMNHGAFMSSFRTVPSETDQRNRESAFAMNTSDHILRTESAGAFKIASHFDESGFVNGSYSADLEANRFETCFGVMPTPDITSESFGIRVNTITDTGFRIVNATDRGAVSSIGEFGINTTADCNINSNTNRLEMLHSQSPAINQTPTMTASCFDLNASVDARFKLDSMTDLIRTRFSTCKNETTFGVTESKARNCQSGDAVDKTYQLIKDIKDTLDSEGYRTEAGSQETANNLNGTFGIANHSIHSNNLVKQKKIRTNCEMGDVKKNIIVTKFNNKTRKKLKMKMSNVSVTDVSTVVPAAKEEKVLIPVLDVVYEVSENGTISTSIMAEHDQSRFNLLVTECGSLLIGSSNSAAAKVKNVFEAPIKVDRRRRRHECKVCGKVVKKSKYLVVHMITHTGDKPYTCAVGKLFWFI